MKMGTIASPWRYETVRNASLIFAKTRTTVERRYDKA